MEKIYNGTYDCMEMPAIVSSQKPISAYFMTNNYVQMKRELAYPETTDLKIWQKWRVKLRNRLRDIMYIDEWGRIPTPEITILSEIKCDGYIRQKITYETLRGSWVIAYLLIPDKCISAAPAVICPHGHFKSGSLNVVDPTMATGVAYGHELAMRGFIVLAPDNAGMGERDVPDSEVFGEKKGGCDLLFRRMNHIGRDITGFRIFELMAGLNILCNLKQVDSSRLGCAGLSGGCWLSQILSALDIRIKAVILSGYFTTFSQTAWIGHCVCHHPHGIGRICDMSDISALIAPRPQFIESGKEDYFYPIEPAYSLVKQAYKLLDAEENLVLDSFEGGHMFRGDMSIPWMIQQLTK